MARAEASVRRGTRMFSMAQKRETPLGLSKSPRNCSAFRMREHLPLEMLRFAK